MGESGDLGGEDKSPGEVLSLLRSPSPLLLRKASDIFTADWPQSVQARRDHRESTNTPCADQTAMCYVFDLQMEIQTNQRPKAAVPDGVIRLSR